MFNNPFETKKDQRAKLSLDLSLLPVDNEWELKFQELMKDEYLSKKYNREKRINDHLDYLKNLCPIVFHSENINKALNVIDIGPGPGELLEITRCLGYNSVGFDAKLEDCEMGVPYISLSKMMSSRQNLDIRYTGFENTINHMPFKENSTLLINSRGSIEQVFKDHLKGVPHREHHNARLLTWSMSKEMLSDFTSLFMEAKRILVSGGVFLIHGNGATNIDDYHNMIMKIVESTEGLICDASDGQTLHRLRKL
tara:strand:+ start:6982 stop:7740 length:759 start_codon:yes stop_codon:yes gene_type:complete